MQAFSFYIPIFYICFRFPLSSQLLIPPAITDKLFSVLHEKFMVGLILVSFLEEEEESFLKINILKQAYLPFSVIGKASKNVERSESLSSSSTFIKGILCRYNQPYFVHTNAPLPDTTLLTSATDLWKLWTEMYANLLGLSGSNAIFDKLIGAKGNSSSFHSNVNVLERLLFNDFFVNIETQTNLKLAFNPKFPSFKTLAFIPRNYMWLALGNQIRCTCRSVQTMQILKFNQSNFYEKPEKTYETPLKQLKNTEPGCESASHLSSHSIIQSIAISCPFCSRNDPSVNQIQHEVTKMEQLLNAVINIDEKSSKIEFIFSSNHSDLPNDYNNLVFKPQKAPDNLKTTTNLRPSLFVTKSQNAPLSEEASVLNPFTVASWIGIAIAYVITTIAFGVVRAVTATNFDQSLHEFVMQILLQIVNEDRLTRRKKLVHNDNGERGTDGADHRSYNPNVGLDNPDMQFNGNNNSKPSNNEEDDANQVNNHGKASRAILQGTIRIVSFVMIATYEGKLYNSITFPRSRLNDSESQLANNVKLVSSTLDKLVTKSTRKAGKYHGMGSRRRGTRLFFQVSKWIMESVTSGTLESLTDGKTSQSQSKVFTINDYVGLFAVFFILIFLAFILFLSEVGMSWAKERLHLRSFKDLWGFVQNGGREIPKIFRQLLERCKVVYARNVLKRKFGRGRVMHHC